MVPPGQTCLGVEYFCFEGDEIWEMPRRRGGRAGDRGARRGSACSTPHKIFNGVKVRVPKAYPMYDASYREAVAEIRGYLESFENLTRPSAATACTATTTRTTRCGPRCWPPSTTLDGDAHDVWSVNHEAEYLEEGPLAEGLADLDLVA